MAIDWQAFKTKLKTILISYLITILMFSGVIVGLILGVILLAVKDGAYTTREVMYIGYLGEILLQMLRCIALPLMISCLVIAIGSLYTSISLRIGGQLIMFIAITKIQAVLLGIILSLSVRPGVGKTANKTDTDVGHPITTVDNFLDLLRNVYPSNMINMNLRLYETVLIKPPNASETDDKYDWTIQDGGNMKDSVNMLGVINSAIFVGAAVAVMKSKGEPLLNFFGCVSKMSKTLTVWILWITPIVIISLVAGEIVKIGSLSDIWTKTALFVVVAVSGHAIQCIVLYPLIYFFLVWKNPFLLYRDFLEAMIIAYVSSSSVDTIPISIRCLENHAKFDSRLVEFVIPIAHNINMDGAAIYMGVATVFVAQLNDIPLSFVDLVSILFLGAAASFAAAGVPHSSIMCIVMVLDGVGLPYHNIALLLAVDLLIDRSATVTNVLGDAVAVAVLTVYNKKLLESAEDSVVEPDEPDEPDEPEGGTP